MHVIEHLKRIPLFSDLRQEQFEQLASQFKVLQFYAAREIVGQGELGNRFVIIDEGIVNLRATDPGGMEKSLGVLSAVAVAGSTQVPINYFGEQMFTSQEPYDYHVHAITDTVVYVLERGDFDALVAQNPRLLSAMPFVEKAERKRTRGFAWIDEGEAVAAVIHKHWWLILPALAKTALGLLVVLGINIGIGLLKFDFLFFVPVVGLILVIGFLLLQLYDWRNDEYVVTNQRVAHIERILITKDLREAVPLDKVLGVKVDQEGLPGILGVTNVVIQSAGREQGNVTFAGVADGKLVQKIIEGQRARVRARQAANERETERGRIQSELREYILPHVVAQERAAVVVNKPTTKPTRLSLGQRVGRVVDSWLGLEIKRPSIVTWRKHWLVLLQQTSKWAGGLVLLDLVFGFLALNPGLQFLPAGGYIAVGLVAIVICLGGILWEWADWRNDTYAVTDTQIIDIERLPFGLKEKSIVATLEQIQDIRVEVDGIIKTVLDFGDLKIETAGQGSQMIFHSIHSPREASDEIFKRIEVFKQRRAEKEINQRNRLYIDALIGYDRIRKEEEYHNKLRNADRAEPADETDDDDDDDDDF